MPEEKKVKRLKNLRLSEVSLVPAGANPSAHVMLYKAEKPEEPKRESKETPGMTVKVNKKEDGTIEVVSVAEDGTETIVETITAPKVEKAEETVSKSDYEAIKKQQEETAKQLAKMQEEATKATFTAKAAEYGNIGIADDVAPVLIAANKSFTEDEFKALETLLKAANARAESSALLKQLSKTGGNDPTDFDSKLEALAKAKVDAGTAATIEIAKGQVMRENADLRDEYAKQWS